MAYIPVVDTVLLELVYEMQGQRMEQTLYFEHDGAMSPTDMTELAIDIKAWWQAQMAPLLANDLSLVIIKVTDLTSNSSPVVEFTTGLPSAATGEADPLPLTDAIVTTFTTPFRGRSFKGRNYIPGVQENIQSAGVLDATFLNNVSIAWDTLFDVLLPTEWTWVVVSRYTDNTPRVNGVTTPITGFRVSKYIATQRRRRQGSGS